MTMCMPCKHKGRKFPWDCETCIREEVRAIAFEIKQQATRHQRATGMKSFLLTDLQMINKMATKMLRRLKAGDRED